MVSDRHPESAATPHATRVPGWWPLISGPAALVLTVFLGYLVMLRGGVGSAGAGSLAIDRAGLIWIDQSRGPILDVRRWC